jgi:hypothetical protein
MRAIMRPVCLLFLFLAACSGNQEPLRVCTLIGCNDGLNVTVVSALQEDFSVTVKSGSQTLHTFTCRPGQQCMAFLENQRPANVTVQIATSAGTISKDYTPEYKASRPNGPDCEPECRQATVTVNVN